jgi:hypothetical protein
LQFGFVLTDTVLRGVASHLRYFDG